MTDKLAYFNLKDTSFDVDAHSIVRKISAQIVDMQDDAIVQCCIDIAKEAGIHDLILLDKKFVLDALREKIQGKGHARWKNVPHEQRSLLFFCSKCGTHSHFKTMYCSACGARMDGEADG